MSNTTCFQTKVRNISGKRLPFSFIGAHGVTLDDGEEYSIDGRVEDYFGANRSNKRKRDAYYRSLQNGLLAVVHTPSEIIYDPTLAEAKILTVVNGAVVVADPCTGVYSSSMAG